MKHPLLILLLALSAIYASCSNSSEQTENSTLATIMSRKSVRSYTEQKLTDAQIETLLKAAMAAPSGINIQPWRFIVVTDQSTKEALQSDGPQRMYSQCAALFVICGETDFINRNAEMKILALTFIAMIGILLVLDSLGINSGIEVLDMHMEKLMVYFAMLFSVIMELIQLRYKANLAKRNERFEGYED